MLFIFIYKCNLKLNVGVFLASFDLVIFYCLAFFGWGAPFFGPFFFSLPLLTWQPCCSGGEKRERQREEEEEEEEKEERLEASKHGDGKGKKKKRKRRERRRRRRKTGDFKKKKRHTHSFGK